MKNKSIIIIMACLLVAAFALGASGVFKLADPKQSESPTSQKEDRLIGALITKESLDLFDMESYINDNINEFSDNMEISAEDSAAYQGRLYATLAGVEPTYEDGRKQMEYVFEGVDGIRYFAPEMYDGDGEYIAACADDAISDLNTHINATDSGMSVSLEGTIYVSVDSDADVFHVNPVYQTADGEVYALSGSGAMFSGDREVGASHSLKIEERSSTTVNGETTGEKSSVEIHMTLVAPPERITIAQFDENDTLLTKAEYLPGTLPDAINAEKGTAYVLVETLLGGEVSRELYQQSDETLSSYICSEDGICMKRTTEMIWN